MQNVMNILQYKTPDLCFSLLSHFRWKAMQLDFQYRLLTQNCLFSRIDILNIKKSLLSMNSTVSCRKYLSHTLPKSKQKFEYWYIRSCPQFWSSQHKFRHCVANERVINKSLKNVHFYQHSALVWPPLLSTLSIGLTSSQIPSHMQRLADNIELSSSLFPKLWENFDSCWAVPAEI